MLRGIIVVTAMLLAAPLHGQQASAPVAHGGAGMAMAEGGEKDVTVARVLAAVIPGTGHIYAGEKSKGWTLMGVTIGSYALGRALGDAACGGKTTGSDRLPACTTGQMIALTGSVISIGAWIYGIVDAGHAVRDHNEALAGETAGGFKLVLLSLPVR